MFFENKYKSCVTYHQAMDLSHKFVQHVIFMFYQQPVWQIRWNARFISHNVYLHSLVNPSVRRNLAASKGQRVVLQQICWFFRSFTTVFAGWQWTRIIRLELIIKPGMAQKCKWPLTDSCCRAVARRRRTLSILDCFQYGRNWIRCDFTSCL